MDTKHEVYSQDSRFAGLAEIAAATSKPQKKRKEQEPAKADDAALDQVLASYKKATPRSKPAKKRKVAPPAPEAEEKYPPPPPPQPKEKKAEKTHAKSPKEHLDITKRMPEDRKAISLLSAYGSNEILGPFLTQTHSYDLKPARLRRLSGPKLQELLTDVEDTLANQGNSAASDAIVRQSLTAIENAVTLTGKVYVNGTTNRCFENDRWRFLLERVKTKYGLGFNNLDPVTELSLVTFHTASMIHMAHKAETPSTDLSEQVVDPRAA